MAVASLCLDSERDKRFYVYVYRDPRPYKKNAPIYVGKGTAANRRAELHWTQRAQNPILRCILDKIRVAGLAPVREIVAWFDDEAQAFELERSLVAKFGRRDKRTGSLANLTDGGDGASGNMPSEEARERMSASRRAVEAEIASDPERMARRSAKQSASRKAAAAKIAADPALQAEVTAALKAGHAKSLANPEVLERRRSTMKAMREKLAADPERMAKRNAAVSAGRRAAHAARAGDPDRSALRSVAGKAAWQDPATRQRYLEAFRLRDAKGA